MQIWLLIDSLSDFLQFNESIVGNNLWEQMTQMNTYMIQVEVLQATKKALATHGPQRHYRNECLCNAMVNFNMIDIVGRGIRKIFNEQWKRHFPMPDYEIDAANKEVTVRLYGNAINEKYTKLLKEKKDLRGVLKILIFESSYKIKVSFRLLFVFCGVFLSSFSVT